MNQHTAVCDTCGSIPCICGKMYSSLTPSQKTLLVHNLISSIRECGIPIEAKVGDKHLDDYVKGLPSKRFLFTEDEQLHLPKKWLLFMNDRTSAFDLYTALETSPVDVPLPSILSMYILMHTNMADDDIVQLVMRFIIEKDLPVLSKFAKDILLEPFDRKMADLYVMMRNMTSDIEEEHPDIDQSILDVQIYFGAVLTSLYCFCEYVSKGMSMQACLELHKMFLCINNSSNRTIDISTYVKPFLGMSVVDVCVEYDKILNKIIHDTCKTINDCAIFESN